ncbi:thymidine phosphorylase [bacterium]|nr:thymidine phosphorylase [bacterium]
MLPAELIKKKRQGDEHTQEEIQFIIDSFMDGSFKDYQMTAWSMAVCFNGMTNKETHYLTQAMKNSGRVVEFKDLNKFVVDKHSTGGVGDKTSLILAPVVASLGIPVSMIAGRGLGHTGGTLDKLESINGFSVDISFDEFTSNVQEHNIGLIGQTEEICPADKKLYALRDVTGTVESIPLICASIMSKKLSEGINGLVLDVKCGSGAFMKTLEDARDLAKNLVSIGEQAGVKTNALISNMNQPLGKYVGNSLEVKECLEIMEGKTCIEKGIDLYEDTKVLSLKLAAQMVAFAKDISTDEAYKLCQQQIKNGEALEKFKQLCKLQSAPDAYNFKIATNTHEVKAQSDGFLNYTDIEKIGLASLNMGGGRATSADVIDTTVGIELHFKNGSSVNEGDTLFTLYCNNSDKLPSALEALTQAFEIQDNIPEDYPLIFEMIRGEDVK